MSCLTWSYASTLLLRRCTGRSTSLTGNDTTILPGCVGFFSPDASCKTPIFSLSPKFTLAPQVSPYSLLLLPLIAPTDSMVWQLVNWDLEDWSPRHLALCSYLHCSRWQHQMPLCGKAHQTMPAPLQHSYCCQIPFSVAGILSGFVAIFGKISVDSSYASHECMQEMEICHKYEWYYSRDS